VAELLLKVLVCEGGVCSVAEVGKEGMEKGGFTKGERTSSLLYIWHLYIHGADPATSGASGVKIWHPPRTGREKGSERGRGRKLQ
jgi:hypothetical protein